MYLDHIRSKLGSVNKAKVHTGKSEVVKRLHRKKGGSIKRAKHNVGGITSDAHQIGGPLTPAPSAAKFALMHKKGGSIKRARHNVGGITSDAHKKGRRVKREGHFLGALAGALGIPAIVSMLRGD